MDGKGDFHIQLVSCGTDNEMSDMALSSGITSAIVSVVALIFGALALRTANITFYYQNKIRVLSSAIWLIYFFALIVSFIFETLYAFIGRLSSVVNEVFFYGAAAAQLFALLGLLIALNRRRKTGKSASEGGYTAVSQEDDRRSVNNDGFLENAGMSDNAFLDKNDDGVPHFQYSSFNSFEQPEVHPEDHCNILPKGSDWIFLVQFIVVYAVFALCDTVFLKERWSGIVKTVAIGTISLSILGLAIMVIVNRERSGLSRGTATILFFACLIQAVVSEPLTVWAHILGKCLHAGIVFSAYDIVLICQIIPIVLFYVFTVKEVRREKNEMLFDQKGFEEQIMIRGF